MKEPSPSIHPNPSTAKDVNPNALAKAFGFTSFAVEGFGWIEGDGSFILIKAGIYVIRFWHKFTSFRFEFDSINSKIIGLYFV